MSVGRPLDETNPGRGPPGSSPFSAARDAELPSLEARAAKQGIETVPDLEAALNRLRSLPPPPPGPATRGAAEGAGLRGPLG